MRRTFEEYGTSCRQWDYLKSKHANAPSSQRSRIDPSALLREAIDDCRPLRRGSDLPVFVGNFPRIILGRLTEPLRPGRPASPRPGSVWLPARFGRAGSSCRQTTFPVRLAQLPRRYLIGSPGEIVTMRPRAAASESGIGNGDVPPFSSMNAFAGKKKRARESVRLLTEETPRC